MKITDFTDYSNGIITYSLENMNSDHFELLGFEDFFVNTYGDKSNSYRTLVNQSYIPNRYKKIETIHKSIYSDNPYRDIPKLNNLLRTMEINDVFNDFNSKKFVINTNLIFQQWEKEAERYNIDISDEKSKFLSIQKNGVEQLKQILTHKRVIDTFLFKLENAYSHSTIKSKQSDGFQQNEKNIKVLTQYVDDNKYQLSLESLIDLVKTGGHGFINLKDDFNSVVKSVLTKIREASPHAYESFAENYLQTLTQSYGNLKDFFVSKLETSISTDITLTKGQKFQRAMLFVDNSVMFVDKENNYLIPESSTQLMKNLNTLYVDIIDFKFRKHPKFAKVFKDKFMEDGDIENLLTTVDYFLTHYHILKQVKFNPKILNNSLEVIDDEIHASVKIFKVNQYAGSILSAKYKEFLTPDVYPFFEKFYDEQLKEGFIQDYIGKKLAAIKSPDDFYTFVKKVHDNFFLFSKDSVALKLDKINKEPVFEDDTTLIVEIKNFEESQYLGTSNWCISRAQNYYDDYTSNHQRQYFVYDFTKSAEDTESMIGITLTHDGRVYAAHKRNDNSVTNEDYVNEFATQILCKQYEEYKEELTLTKQIIIERLTGINLRPELGEIVVASRHGNKVI